MKKGTSVVDAQSASQLHRRLGGGELLPCLWLCNLQHLNLHGNVRHPFIQWEEWTWQLKGLMNLHSNA